MSKQTINTNFRVIVEPADSVYGLSRSIDAIERDCRSIVDQVKRHVDGVRHVYMEHDVEAFCEHCGYAWTEESADYNGGCCSKDEEAHIAKAGGAA